MTGGPLRVTWQSRWGLPIGYASTSEELARALLARRVDLSYRPTPWPRSSHIADPVLAELAKRPAYEDAVQVSYEQADLFYTAHAGYKVGFTMLEVDGIPRAWAEACIASRRCSIHFTGRPTRIASTQSATSSG